MRRRFFTPTETKIGSPKGSFFVEGGRLGDAFGGACSAPREPSESPDSPCSLATRRTGYYLHDSSLFSMMLSQNFFKKRRKEDGKSESD